MNNNPLHFSAMSKNNFSFLRVQDGISPFFEKPSDKHGCISTDIDVSELRITAVELFSHFTADIIKEKVIFIR